MRSLFLKIFVSYWIAQALFFVIAVLVGIALRPSRELANLQSLQDKFLSDAVQAYQAGGDTGAWRYFRGIHESEHVRLYVFDENGNELLRRKPPAWVVKAENGEMHTAESFWGRLRPTQFLRASTTTPDGHHYVLITELFPDPHPIFGWHGIPGLGIFIGIVSSGLVCYLLARYLTSPIGRLRDATQKLAAGDLSARAGVPRSRRGDELAQLTRDFDRMAERLESLVTAQSRLLSDISHELRSPLTRMNIALELARQRTGPEANSALDRIEREASRLNELIHQLLTISRLEGGDESVERAPVPLGDLIDEIARDAAFEAQSRDCKVAVVIADPCEVVGNPDLLYSAIENVVRNAIRYTAEGSTVEIRLERGESERGAEAVIRVTDAGPGVPEDALEKLFRPFYRIDDARRRTTGGVGLGLAITDRAVRIHKGNIRAANRPGGGLMVEIRLPLHSARSTEDTLSPISVGTADQRS
jgi:two-component system, OmpR family, sensor histidine kinase CpxA